MESQGDEQEATFHKRRVMFAVVHGEVLLKKASPQSHREWLSWVSDEDFARTLRGYLAPDGTMRAYVGDFSSPSLDEHSEGLLAAYNALGARGPIGLGCVKGAIGQVWDAELYVDAMELSGDDRPR